MENIMKAKSFLLEYSFYGAILSTTILYLIYKTNPDYYKGDEKRASAVLSYFFGVITLSVFGTAFYNFETAKENTTEIKAFVSDKSKNFRYGTTYLKLKIDSSEERFNPTHKEWEKIEENDTLLLTVGQGRLGYDHILTFTKADNNTIGNKNAAGN
jgi:hypothetical protein